MYDKNNIFAKILKGEISCDKVYEDEEVMAFYDKYPNAKVHVLVVPKGEYVSFVDFANKAGAEKVGAFFEKVAKVAELLGLEEKGYRISSNIGHDGGQVIYHFHVHIMGGERLGAKMPG